MLSHYKAMNDDPGFIPLDFKFESFSTLTRSSTKEGSNGEEGSEEEEQIPS